MDSSPEVSSVWGSIWSEGAPSEAAALRMYGGETAGVVREGLASSNWGRKKAAAEVRRRGGWAEGMGFGRFARSP